MNIININHVNTKRNLGVIPKSSFSKVNSETAGPVSNGRFDSFTIVGTDENYKNGADIKELDSKTAELVRNMSKFSDEEKSEIAYGAYLEMAKVISGMKQAIEYDITCFSEFKDEKAYYTDLLNSGGKIGEGGGRYKFGGNVAGDVVESEDIENALSEVQNSIDSWCGKNSDERSMPRQLPEGVYGIFTPEVGYRIVEKIFRREAEVFSAATGISDSALELKDNEFFFSKEDVNEENFLEKANTLLNAVTDRYKKLGDIMSEYSYNHRHLMDRLKERLETAEEREEKKDISISEMILQYDKYLHKAYEKFNVISQKE